MSSRARDVWMRAISDGLHEPSEKRVRVEHGGHIVANTERAVLVWEPRRVVRSYAVPIEALRAELVPADAAPSGPDPSQLRVLTRASPSPCTPPPANP